MPIPIVFMGSPQFAVPSLSALADKYQVVGVVTQPDRPAGRGRSLTPPPVKITAEKLGIPIMQPGRLRDSEAMEQLQSWKPELIVVAAFGQILRPAVLDLPRLGCINVHASLLPRWRGAAPIQAAILHGDQETGITIMKMDPGIDTGGILAQQNLLILAKDTSSSLGERLAEVGAALLLNVLPGYLDGTVLPTVQDETRATYAPMLQKTDGLLDLAKAAADLARQVRALQPWPGTYLTWQGHNLKINKASVMLDFGPSEVGKRLVFQGLPAVTTGQGLLILEELQPAGKRSMSGKDFLSGAKSWTKDNE